MAYKKQPLRPRICTHCGDPHQAVDRRRMYCCHSCNTLASNARRRAVGDLVISASHLRQLLRQYRFCFQQQAMEKVVANYNF